MDLKRGFGLVGAVGVTLSVGACTSVDGSSPAASASAPPSAAVSSNAAAQTPSAPTSAPAPESSSAPATSAGAASSEAAASSVPTSDPLGSGQQGLVTTKVGAEAKTSKLSVKVTKVVDDEQIEAVADGRHETIGALERGYGDGLDRALSVAQASHRSRVNAGELHQPLLQQRARRHQAQSAAAGGGHGRHGNARLAATGRHDDETASFS